LAAAAAAAAAQAHAPELAVRKARAGRLVGAARPSLGRVDRAAHLDLEPQRVVVATDEEICQQRGDQNDRGQQEALARNSHATEWWLTLAVSPRRAPRRPAEAHASPRRLPGRRRLRSARRRPNRRFRAESRSG